MLGSAMFKPYAFVLLPTVYCLLPTFLTPQRGVSPDLIVPSP